MKLCRGWLLVIVMLWKLNVLLERFVGDVGDVGV